MTQNMTYKGFYYDKQLNLSAATLNYTNNFFRLQIDSTSVLGKMTDKILQNMSFIIDVADSDKKEKIIADFAKQHAISNLYYFKSSKIFDIFPVKRSKKDIIRDFCNFVTMNRLQISDINLNTNQIFAALLSILLFESINKQKLVFDYPKNCICNYRWINVRRDIEEIESSFALSTSLK